MKTTLLSIIFIASSFILFAQNQPDSALITLKNNAYISLGAANGSLFSIGYERRLLISPQFFLTAQLGVGYNQQFRLCIFGPCTTPVRKYLIIPQHITANFGKGKNFIEFGIGGTLIAGISSPNYLLYPIIGYRFQPLKLNKTLVRISLGFPFFSYKDLDIIFIPIGISLGGSF